MWELSHRDFLNELAAKSATPGGGAVSGILGAQATALFEMVANFSGIKELGFLQVNRQKFMELTEADIQAFQKMESAYSIPKENPEQRTAAIQEALIGTTTVPCEVAEVVAETLVATERAFQENVNSNVISDAAIACDLCRCCLETVKSNLRVNFKFLKDEQFKEQIGKRYNLAVGTSRLSLDSITAMANQVLPHWDESV